MGNRVVNSIDRLGLKRCCLGSFEARRAHNPDGKTIVDGADGASFRFFVWAKYLKNDENKISTDECCPTCCSMTQEINASVMINHGGDKGWMDHTHEILTGWNGDEPLQKDVWTLERYFNDNAPDRSPFYDRRLEENGDVTAWLYDAPGIGGFMGLLPGTQDPQLSLDHRGRFDFRARVRDKCNESALVKEIKYGFAYSGGYPNFKHDGSYGFYILSILGPYFPEGVTDGFLPPQLP